MQTVERDKYEKIIKRSKKLQPKCCKCGGQVTVSVIFPSYGSVGARCECTKCKLSGSFHSITELVKCADGIATPITEKSFVDGIKRAIKEWDGMIEEIK